jgi:hypothetical protein
VTENPDTDVLYIVRPNIVSESSVSGQMQRCLYVFVILLQERRLFSRNIKCVCRMTSQCRTTFFIRFIIVLDLPLHCQIYILVIWILILRFLLACSHWNHMFFREYADTGCTDMVRQKNVLFKMMTPISSSNTEKGKILQK